VKVTVGAAVDLANTETTTEAIKTASEARFDQRAQSKIAPHETLADKGGNQVTFSDFAF
jgi:hypothetical protein